MQYVFPILLQVYPGFLLLDRAIKIKLKTATKFFLQAPYPFNSEIIQVYVKVTFLIHPLSARHRNFGKFPDDVSCELLVIVWQQEFSSSSLLDLSDKTFFGCFQVAGHCC